MDQRASAFWVRLKANRLAYSLTILVTLTIGILMGTIISYGVKGQESKKASDATPLTVPAPQQLSNQFSNISKQLEPSVVNINTESTIKTPQRRRRAPGGTPGSPDDQNPFDDFFDRLFSLLNFFHAAKHERRKIALHNLFFARFFAAKHLPSNLSLPLLRGVFILGAYIGKGKGREKHCDQNKETNSAQTVAPIS